MLVGCTYSKESVRRLSKNTLWTPLSTAQKVCLTLLLERIALRHIQRESLTWVGLVLALVLANPLRMYDRDHQLICRGVLDQYPQPSAWSSHCLVQQNTTEDAEGSLSPVATAYKEDAKNYHPPFVPYHKMFASRSDIERYRQENAALSLSFDHLHLYPWLPKIFVSLSTIGISYCHR
jgi:hypothetical protein